MKRLFAAGLCAVLLFTGCTQPAPVFSSPESTSPAATLPAPGDPGSVACKSTYTEAYDPDAVAARVGDAVLTNAQLQLWYWAEAAQYCAAHDEPDLGQPLDTQPCGIDGSTGSWQQYFLQQALDRWHTVQALIRHSEECPLPQEDAHRPDTDTLREYMDGMPATEYLYRYGSYYQPNTQHQSWLDSLPEALEDLAESLGYGDTAAMASDAFGSDADALLDFARELNYGYMYFTELTYSLEKSNISAESSEDAVSFRQILLYKDSATTLSSCLTQAHRLLSQWADERKPSAESFATLAARNSRDAGSALNGGLYRNIRREQLPRQIADWCFDEARQEGDTTVITTDSSVHVLYFLSREQSTRQDPSAQTQLLSQLREAYPMEVSYHAITLQEASGCLSLSQLLYPDIAHERYPQIPLYLQQSYPDVKYGDYKLTTNGCGITSLAMLASYMTDRELTPAALAARYGSYSGATGTAGSLFEDAPPQLGFYLIKKTYDWKEAREYMRQGHSVICLQYKGYWTSGGHYLVLETLTEEGLIRIRDSNMYNYAKLSRHKEDEFPWDTITGACQGFWIYEKKSVTTPACTRCGDPETLPVLTVTDYLCEKCETAQTRRNLFLGTA